MTHDVQACHDQHIAAVRDYAQGCMEMIDWFQKFDFSRDEAMALLMQFLDGQVYQHAST
jgi:ABC-type proline/glycine betaine transport system substrate-binding protein